MRQVFVKNGASSALEPADTTGSTRKAASFGDLGSGEVGCWNLDKYTYGGWQSTALFNVGVESGTVDSNADLVTLANPLWLVNRLQFAQGYGSGNPIATPIIDTKNIISINYQPYAAATRHKVDTTIPNVAVLHNAKFVIRTTPTHYLEFAEPANALNDLSDGGYAFPLSVFNTTNHKVINVEFTPASTSSGAGANALKTAIEGHALLNSLFTAEVANTDDLDVKARHAGVVFDVIVENVNTGATVTGAVDAAADLGVGDPFMVLGDELKARALAGNFNRMYFPQTFTTFTSTTATYDKVTIVYRIDGDRGVVKGSQFGELVIYDDNQDASSGGLEDIFVYTNNTAKEYRFAAQ